MNSCQKYFSVCLLALLSQAAFAQGAPQLGSASSFAVLSAAANGGGAVTCTDSTISGDVGSSGQPASVVRTSCSISGAVVAPVPAQVVTDFDDAYAKLRDDVQCTETSALTSLGDHTFTPGVYCFNAAVTETNAVWTLKGGSSDLWIFKIGTQEPGALTGTGFSVLMDGGQACNVYWWVDAAVTMTTSGFPGTILAGAAITTTGLNPATPFNGNALAKAAVTLTNFAVTGCQNGTSNPPAPKHAHCNQGVGNGPEGCDPGNSNQGNPFRSNDELGGIPGNPGRKGGNRK